VLVEFVMVALVAVRLIGERVSTERVPETRRFVVVASVVVALTATNSERLAVPALITTPSMVVVAKVEVPETAKVPEIAVVLAVRVFTSAVEVAFKSPTVALPAVRLVMVVVMNRAMVLKRDVEVAPCSEESPLTVKSLERARFVAVALERVVSPLMLTLLAAKSVAVALVSVALVALRSVKIEERALNIVVKKFVVVALSMTAFVPRRLVM